MFHAGFVADCQNISGADLHDAGTGVPTIAWLYVFLIGIAPLLILRRTALLFTTKLVILFDFLSLSSLWSPYAGSDCGIHSGNDQDFTGNYIIFQLGCGLMLTVTYLATLTDLAVRAMQWLLRLSRKRITTRQSGL